MTVKLIKGFCSHINQQPLQISFIFALTVSIFLPLYITVPVIIAAFTFFLSSKDRRKAIFNTPFAMLFAFLFLILLVIPLIYKNYYGFACGVLVVIFFVLEYFINGFMTEKLFNQLCSICCVMSLICVAAAIIERIFSLQTRAMAFTYNANFYGYIIELIILICFYKFVQTKKPVFFLIIAANIVALFLSDCRSAWTGILAGLLVFFIILKKKKSALILVSLAVAVTLSIFIDPTLFPRHNDIVSTTADRVGIWSAAFHDFLNHPVFGRGLLALYQVSGNIITPHAHNILLDLLECTGVVGTAIIIFFFVLLIKKLISSYKLGDDRTKACVALCCGVLAATFIHGITDMPIMGIHTGLLFFLILSLSPKPLTEAQTQESETLRCPYFSKIFSRKL